MKISIFETFSGLGSQAKALGLIEDVDVDHKGISEWYIDAIIAYARIHHYEEYKRELESCKLTKKEILEELKDGSFSSDSKKLSNISRIKESKLKDLYVSNKVSKNLGSVYDIQGENLPEDIDIFTYSFPCQDISLQGKKRGLEKDSGTTSSLVWEIMRILNEAKEANKLPKILLMENVKALLGKKSII